MARKKNQAAEGESQAAESTNGDEHTTPANKTDAVRMAIEAGHDGIQAGSTFIKEEFGLDVSPAYFSSTKSRLGSGAAKKTPQRRGRKPRVADNGSTPARKPANTEAGLLEAMEAIKPLVESMGKDQVYRIVDLLGS